MYCADCGKPIPPGAASCPSCPAGATSTDAISPKDKGLLILLASLLGVFGVDRFYRGQLGLGLLKLFTFGGFGVWSLIDFVLYCVAAPPGDADDLPILDRRSLEYLRAGRR